MVGSPLWPKGTGRDWPHSMETHYPVGVPSLGCSKDRGRSRRGGVIDPLAPSIALLLSARFNEWHPQSLTVSPSPGGPGKAEGMLCSLKHLRPP